jgi:trans-aconitate methyltransferase
MSGYAIAYRLGVTPWERYAREAAGSTGALLDREETGRPRPLGRALDLGCGRGLHTAELARRGWEAVGVDAVPRAVEAAAVRVPAARFVVADVTNLSPEALGSFDLFLDIG